ncbi:hypothetical protein [uncultured Campylobacter sp.]|uniref:hypothetical protein n=1 Tax=uncultured Campylobacter sp. TaxID=218934 RepID=UPI0026347BD1|nr:hypothetical protein [uncultured Campylobacter sp.]
MVLIKATRVAISALISASICFGAVEAQDHGAASGQKQTMQGGGRDDRTPADNQSSEINAAKRADEQADEAQNFKTKRRYFRSCSCLHKQKSKGPARLYDEISQEQAEKSAAYFIGYFKEGKLSRYEKIYEGERAFSSEDIKR